MHTLCIMESINVAFVAKQMGHETPETTYRKYYKWIDKADKAREKHKLSARFTQARKAVATVED